MSKDITSIVAGWDPDPDELQVRIVPGDDGREKLQMRLDLGLIQMELDGRPDGCRPHDCESLLEYYTTRERESEARAERFVLLPRQCVELMREGVQYYHRYLALFQLERYDLVARDTARNLRLFAFVRRFAGEEGDRLQFDQYRPYVTMMHARALGQIALARQDHAAALRQIDDGIAGIRAFLEEYNQTERERDCQELSFLIKWRREVDLMRPVGPVERLEQQLELAVSTERFEEAARIRDQILRLRNAN